MTVMLRHGRKGTRLNLDGLSVTYKPPAIAEVPDLEPYPSITEVPDLEPYRSIAEVPDLEPYPSIAEVPDSEKHRRHR